MSVASQSNVALVCIEPDLAAGEYAPFSFGIRRIQAALQSGRGDRPPPMLLESRSRDVDDWVEQIEASDADVVGLSTYVWSFPTLIQVAQRLKANDPARTVVMGGPSARPAMLDLAPFAEAARCIDALVVRDGERAFSAIVEAASRSPNDLRKIPGLAVRGLAGWASTGEPPELRLDDLPSPVRMGLVPSDRTVAIETFRGCPLSCSFCQWGEAGPPPSVFSTEYLTAELSALRAMNAPSAQLVDAGLNLNSRAFRNLAEAERSVGFFRNASFFCSLYPSSLNESHLAFLSALSRPRVDVGLQSFSRVALDAVDRSFSESRFAEVMRELARVAEVEVEIILGLPGDTPEEFRKTLARALELGCRVRVFHCLVLPDALLTRSHPEHAVAFDPMTLRLRSCTGFSPDALARERAFLVALAEEMHGEITDDMWSFPPPHERATRREAIESAGREGVVWIRGKSMQPVGPDIAAALREAVLGASEDRWVMTSATVGEGELLVHVLTARTELVVELCPSVVGGRSYRTMGGIAVSYRAVDGAKEHRLELTRPELADLERVAAAMVEIARRVLSTPPP